jgi:GH15 family glucan-1,4-alpha-glucosidase
LGELHPEIQHFVVDLADAAARRWTEPDAGMWEMRGEPRHHLSSKVLCWVALDRAVELAPHLGLHARVGAWGAERDRIREAVLSRGWSNERRAYAQAFDSAELDAAALLMPLVGFLPATDPRMRATIEAIARDLTKDGLVLRYRNRADGTPTGWPARRGPSSSAPSGSSRASPGPARSLGPRPSSTAWPATRTTSAARRGGRPGQRRAARQLPQAFSHVGLINAAWDIDRARGQTADRARAGTRAERG